MDKTTLHHTPLSLVHEAAGAKMVDFAGWYLPIEYSSLREEHDNVRSSAGMFDFSHMGEVRVAGPDATSFLEYVTCNHVARLDIGQAQYSAFLNDQGGVIDDIIVYREAADRYLICVNAANREIDVVWLKRIAEIRGGRFEIDDVSAFLGQIALQGPRAVEVIRCIPELRAADIESLKYFRFKSFVWQGVTCIAARTGYTGEDGIEFFVPQEVTSAFWDLLAANPLVTRCGLGARDTLRLEAGYPLHGHELKSTVLALESGLAWIVKFEKGEFIGREALLRARDQGLLHELIGFEVAGRGIVRHGDLLRDKHGEVRGEVTSGTLTPTVGRAIGMALTAASWVGLGDSVFADVRGRSIECRVVKLPLYTAVKRTKLANCG